MTDLMSPLSLCTLRWIREISDWPTDILIFQEYHAVNLFIAFALDGNRMIFLLKETLISTLRTATVERSTPPQSVNWPLTGIFIDKANRLIIAHGNVNYQLMRGPAISVLPTWCHKHCNDTSAGIEGMMKENAWDVWGWILKQLTSHQTHAHKQKLIVAAAAGVRMSDA